jgi:hypothetical protein
MNDFQMKNIFNDVDAFGIPLIETYTYGPADPEKTAIVPLEVYDFFSKWDDDYGNTDLIKLLDNPVIKDYLKQFCCSKIPVTVYRGLHFFIDEETTEGKGGLEHAKTVLGTPEIFAGATGDMVCRGMCSWSKSLSVADNFATDGDPDELRIIVKGTIPPKDVIVDFSLLPSQMYAEGKPDWGFHEIRKSEREVLVKSGKYNIKIVSAILGHKSKTQWDSRKDLMGGLPKEDLNSLGIPVAEAGFPVAEAGFKSFDDPWKVMSPEDRREANRLQIAALKAFPSSPKQKELTAKLEVILNKYGIGSRKEAVKEARTKSLKINGQEVEAVLMAGGPGFKIYSVPEGVLVVAGRKQLFAKESDPNYKAIMNYVTLSYQRAHERDAIKKEFETLLASIKSVKEHGGGLGSVMPKDREKEYKTLQGFEESAVDNFGIPK